MRLQSVSLSCIIVVTLVISDVIFRSASASTGGSLLGVAPQDEDYYKSLSKGTIKCRDGSNVFSKSQLNDDFCDCPDGSDEPGTPACPNGKFYCKNAGHAPVFLFSSRVNDGICDCCDGSDEYDGKVKCSNTCWEAGKVAREKLTKKIETYRGGVTIRKREIEQAKAAIAKEEAELAGLKDEEKILKKLVDQLKDRKELIEKAEEKERLQKEKEEKERVEAEAAKQKDGKAEEKHENLEHSENDIHDEIGTVHQPSQDFTKDHQESTSEPVFTSDPVKEALPEDEVNKVKDNILQNTEQLDQESNVDGEVDTDSENQEKNVAEDTESLSREELGRLVASRWTGEKTEQPTEEEDASVSKDQPPSDETPNETSDEEYNGYDSEDDEHKYEDENEDPVDDFGGEDHDNYDSSSTYKSDDEADLSDSTSSSSSSWLEKIQQKAASILRAVNLFQTPVNTSDAAHVRKEYDENSAKLSKIQSRISSLTKKLKQDFGPEKEFYSFYGQCFEGKENKYVYKVCPFKQATQEEGHSTTRLGSWEKFEDAYRTMHFSNGDKCWNGPDRSLKVKLRCGLKSEVTDVDEPSRCEYVAVLSTPALCVDAKLKELEQKLESMNKEQPQGHDEL